jgi:hypothetical protein
VSADRAERRKYKLISCNVFLRELSAAISSSPNVIDPEFLELGLHETPGTLGPRLQERIDAAGGEYDAVLLCYGLCGNGTVGIRARDLPLVLPRAHDCCTILLGSRTAFLERFGSNLSASWSSAGYIERGSTYFRASELGRAIGHGLEYEELVAQYGEDNARYVWDTLHPELAEKELRFIEMPETEGLGYAELMRAKSVEEGKQLLLLRGDSRLLRALLAGDWSEEEFLVIPPGKRLVGVYDQDRVIAAE